MPKTEPFDSYSDEYDQWFIEHEYVFQSELKAIRKVLPVSGRGIEIGVGSGIFAEPLGILEGIDPSPAMRAKARQRNINVIDAVAENLPYADESVDFAVMITTLCFVDDLYQCLSEARRVLKDGGTLIIGFVDKDSPVGQLYLQHRDESVFYRNAVFYSSEELSRILNKTGFGIEKIFQTVFGKLDEIDRVQDVLEGYGKGSFVAMSVKKSVS